MSAREGSGGLGGLVDRLEPISDRLNPILVKEVRQALRGKSFGWSFMLLVTLVAVIGAMIVLTDEVNPSSILGVNFTLLLVWMLGIGMIVMVPLQAFQSLGNEWEAETYDQLTLSGLASSRIASGKLFSAALQSALILAAFLPFVALGFLMRGVDLVAVFAVLVLLFAVSIWASALALALSSMTRARTARVVLYVLLGVLTFIGTGSVASFCTQLLFDPAVLTSSGYLAAFASALLAGSVAAAIAHTFGCGQLAHPEENTATSLRLLTALGVLLMLGWLWLAESRGWMPGLVVQAFAAFGSIVTALLGMLWAAERQRLGRRVAFDLSVRGSTARKIPAMLLPGGSRGIQFTYVLLGVIAAFILLIDGGGSFLLEERRWFGVWTLCTFSFYAGVPAAVLARWSDRPGGAWGVRLVMVLFAAACVVLPAIVGLLIDDPDLTYMRHPLNLFWVLIVSADGDLDAGAAWATLALGALGLLVNLPRIARGTGEVLRARRGEHHEADPAVERSRERMTAS